MINIEQKKGKQIYGILSHNHYCNDLVDREYDNTCNKNLTMKQ